MTTNTIKRAAVVATIVTLTSVALLAALIFWINDFVSRSDQCDTQVINEFPSPNGRRRAMLILSNCGATTPFVSSIVLDPTEDIGVPRDRVFSVKDKNNMEVVWDASGDITIVYDTPPLIYTQTTIWRTRRISYRERFKP